jgi:hypothetical protein
MDPGIAANNDAAKHGRYSNKFEYELGENLGKVRRISDYDGIVERISPVPSASPEETVMPQ